MTDTQHQCPLCRRSLPVSARFCGACGQLLVSPGTPAPALVAPLPQATKAAAARKPKIDIFRAALLAVIGIALLFAVGSLGDTGFAHWYHSTHTAAGARIGVDTQPLAAAKAAEDSEWAERIDCWYCHGSGKSLYVVPDRYAHTESGIEEPCPVCHGTGWVFNRKLLPHYRPY